MSVLRPEAYCYVTPEPMTWRRRVRWLASEAWFYFVQALLFAGMVASFGIAFASIARMFHR